MKDETRHFNYSINTACYLISHIYWLDKLRKSTKEEDVITGINLSISILLCTYIESVLYELLSYIIHDRINRTDDAAYKKLLKNTLTKLSKASWTQYLDIFEVILPKPVNNYTDNETWKGISLLFNLRNVMVHGKSLNSKLVLKNDKIEVEYIGIYEKAMIYFKEQKVLLPHQLSSSSHKILSTRATKHFIKITEKFVDKVSREVIHEQKIDPIGLSNSYKYTLIAKHNVDLDSILSQNKKFTN